MNTKTKQKIKKIIKTLGYTNKNLTDLDYIQSITEELETQNIINFSFLIRHNQSQTDHWLQTEYYSKKLQKTIIFDYNPQDSFKDINELITTIELTQKEINKFEKSISIETKSFYFIDNENSIIQVTNYKHSPKQFLKQLSHFTDYNGYEEFYSKLSKFLNCQIKFIIIKFTQ